MQIKWQFFQRIGLGTPTSCMSYSLWNIKANCFSVSLPQRKETAGDSACECIAGHSIVWGKDSYWSKGKWAQVCVWGRKRYLSSVSCQSTVCQFRCWNFVSSPPTASSVMPLFSSAFLYFGPLWIEYNSNAWSSPSWGQGLWFSFFQCLLVVLNSEFGVLLLGWSLSISHFNECF